MSDYPHDIHMLETAIGYKFNDINTLQRALTHSSYANEWSAKGVVCESNERLEFLGDAVLELVTSEFLYENYSEYPEGRLTKLRAGVVCERALASYSSKIELGNYLLLGNGEEAHNGRQNNSMLADAFEAILAAIFLDGKENGKQYVMDFLIPFVEEEAKNLVSVGNTGDYKSLLQQFIQQSGNNTVEYVLVDVRGPDHRREFTIEARMDSNILGRGVGSRKGIAEQNAAKEALILFGQLDAQGQKI